MRKGQNENRFVTWKQMHCHHTVRHVDVEHLQTWKLCLIPPGGGGELRDLGGRIRSLSKF